MARKPPTNFERATWTEDSRARTVLNMRSGHLATESSRDASYCVRSLNNNGIKVRSARDKAGSSQSANISRGMRFEECRPRLDQSEFRPMADVCFPVLVSPANAKTAHRLTAHRWLSWLSTGLSRGRSRVQFRPDQHSGSLNNWGESAAFVTTSANG